MGDDDEARSEPNQGAAGNRFCREVGHKVFICVKKRPLKPIRAQREKMEKECPFILPQKAIKFEEIDKFLVVKASENLMAAGRRGVGTSLLLARRMEMAGEEHGGKFLV